MWRNSKGQFSPVRESFRNGDSCGHRKGCDQCEPLMINGMFCHETGCPNAWRDTKITCFECGFDFYPDERYRTVCNDCNQQEDQDNERTL